MNILVLTLISYSQILYFPLITFSYKWFKHKYYTSNLHIFQKTDIQNTPTQCSSMTCRILKIFLPLPWLFPELQCFCTSKVAYLTLKGMPSTINDKKWTKNIYGLNHQQMSYITTQAMYIYDTFF